jgi:HNH endonuclease
MLGFEYPTEPHARRHGPAGYEDYGSYRAWLRDEFTFRCVYCLHREQWYGRGATFHIDHFTPVAKNEDGKCEYTNLLYVCATCNEAKRAVLGLPNPCEVAFGDCLRILPDGHIEALNDDGKKLRQVLRLDSDSNVRNRSRWMRAIETLKTNTPALYEEYMGFPHDLPDLCKKQAPTNTKPEGALNCYFALRERGELPLMY